jgi:hypothetical protein
MESAFRSAGLAGGNYGYCVKRVGGPAVLALRSGAQYEPASGIKALPVKTDAVITPTTYAYGWWVNNVSIPCAFGSVCAARTQADSTSARFDPELFRAQVRAALQTW